MRAAGVTFGMMTVWFRVARAVHAPATDSANVPRTVMLPAERHVGREVRACRSHGPIAEPAPWSLMLYAIWTVAPAFADAGGVRVIGMRSAFTILDPDGPDPVVALVAFGGRHAFAPSVWK